MVAFSSLPCRVLDLLFCCDRNPIIKIRSSSAFSAALKRPLLNCLLQRRYFPNPELIFYLFSWVTKKPNNLSIFLQRFGSSDSPWKQSREKSKRKEGKKRKKKWHLLIAEETGDDVDFLCGLLLSWVHFEGQEEIWNECFSCHFYPLLHRLRNPVQQRQERMGRKREGHHPRRLIFIRRAGIPQLWMGLFRRLLQVREFKPFLWNFEYSPRFGLDDIYEYVELEEETAVKLEFIPFLAPKNYFFIPVILLSSLSWEQDRLYMAEDWVLNMTKSDFVWKLLWINAHNREIKEWNSLSKDTLRLVFWKTMDKVF